MYADIAGKSVPAKWCNTILSVWVKIIAIGLMLASVYLQMQYNSKYFNNDQLKPKNVLLVSRIL